MDSPPPPPAAPAPPPPPPCACPCCCSPFSPASPRRSVKRKLSPSSSPTPAADGAGGVALIEPESEAAALRAALAAAQATIRDLCAELDEERNAAASATNETMSMILRLQHEKAEAVMEARQFKRFAEEKMEHDQHLLLGLEDMLYQRDSALQSLAAEADAYRHRLLTYGIELPEIRDDACSDSDYPPLRCDVENHAENGEEIQSIEHRIRELEGSSPSGSNVMEKEALDEQFEENQRSNEDGFPVYRDRSSDEGSMSDGAHTVDVAEVVEERCTVRVENVGGGEVEVGDIKRLYARLQALEADRESMKQALISMRTEKAQLVLLKEIAQQLCKEAKMEPERSVVQKPSFVESFWSFWLYKWIVSILTWRRKSSQSRYTFGMSKNNAGLLLLLDKSPRTSHWIRFRGMRG